MFRSEQRTVTSNTHQVLSCNHIWFKCSVCVQVTMFKNIVSYVTTSTHNQTQILVDLSQGDKIPHSHSQNMISGLLSHCWEL